MDIVSKDEIVTVEQIDANTVAITMSLEDWQRVLAFWREVVRRREL